jgi:hypothetical protein
MCVRRTTMIWVKHMVSKKRVLMRNNWLILYMHLTVTFVLVYTISNAQRDTLTFDNGEIVIGEIKLLKKRHANDRNRLQ